MKTTLALSLITVFCFALPVVSGAGGHRSLDNIQQMTDHTFLVGAGKINAKNGTNFVIQSDDGNEYLAPFQEGYDVGDYVYHADPVNGWVDILGSAE